MSPLKAEESAEYLADTFKLSSDQTSSLLESSEEIGFVDSESLGQGSKIYFNGNLFRRESVGKTKLILSSLSASDAAKVTQLDQQLKKNGCVLQGEAVKVLGNALFDKLHAASMYDVNVVNNDNENVAYVTKPAAFSKYGNPFADDALDLAKALVSSLTYGMTRSAYERGQIRFLHALLNKLIRGGWVGPVAAIGQDYRALELRSVVEVRNDYGNRYSMRLLKKEVGEMALQVLTAGDGAELPLLQGTGSAATSYVGPESNREKRRKKQELQGRKATRDLIMSIRTGGVV